MKFKLSLEAFLYTDPVERSRDNSRKIICTTDTSMKGQTGETSKE